MAPSAYHKYLLLANGKKEKFMHRPKLLEFIRKLVAEMEVGDEIDLKVKILSFMEAEGYGDEQARKKFTLSLA